MTATQHFIRYAPQGIEWGPFTDAERADIDAAGPTGAFWRTEVMAEAPLLIPHRHPSIGRTKVRSNAGKA